MKHVILALNTTDIHSDMAILNKAGFEVARRLVGQYKHDNGTTVQETSYLIRISGNMEYAKILQLAGFHNQESVLVLDTKHNAKLRYIQDQSEISLGKFTGCSRDIAVNSTAYTYDPSNGEYYVCK